MRKVVGTCTSLRPHRVGDGFPVQSMFSHTTHGQHVSRFLLLDYAKPAEFPPTHKSRVISEHPHRGFEIVIIAYQGEVEHRDSTGPGDVQWMTAASGILREELRSPRAD